MPVKVLLTLNTSTNRTRKVQRNFITWLLSVNPDIGKTPTAFVRLC